MQERGFTVQLPDQDARRNLLLDALPAGLLDRIGWRLETVELRPGRVLHHAGEPLAAVYFPTTCLVSLGNQASDGNTVQVALVGLEGLVGTGAILAGGSAFTAALVIHGGKALRCPADVLQGEFERSVAFRQLLLSYLRDLLVQVVQRALCTHHHTPTQQLCTLLLLALDRLPGPAPELSLTHHGLAGLIGVRRETISQAAARLQACGFLAYQRGRIQVLNRRGLELCACECYERIRSSVRPPQRGLP